MEKEFIKYEQALELKELGFDEPCFGYYYTTNGKDWQFTEKSEYYRLDDEINIGSKFSLLAPTFSQAFRWFREKYKIHIVINLTIIDNWYFELYDLNDKRNAEIKTNENEFETYGEAELECLKKLIEIAKEKK